MVAMLELDCHTFILNYCIEQNLTQINMNVCNFYLLLVNIASAYGHIKMGKSKRAQQVLQFSLEEA